MQEMKLKYTLKANEIIYKDNQSIIHPPNKYHTYGTTIESRASPTCSNPIMESAMYCTFVLYLAYKSFSTVDGGFQLQASRYNMCQFLVSNLPQ